MEPSGVKRKLTVILAADVEGFSRMMGIDEEATHKTLRAYREIVDGLIARHEGRIFGTAGDSVVAEFASPVEAVRSAISIQEELRVRNTELPEDRQMRFRIGINLGDVIVDGDDIFGDGVNVAARLEGVAEAGGICVSRKVFEEVKHKLSVGFEDIGPQEVKNIAEPVPAFRIVAGPISVLPDEAAATAKGARWRIPAVALALVAVVAGGGTAIWSLYLSGPVPLTSFPSNISTDSMPSKDIEALMTGMKIQGVSKKNGRPFIIEVKADKTVDVEMGRTGALAGTTFRETGKWWAENYRFCMQFSRFAQGRKMCPRIVKEGEKITASRGDGTRLNWTLGK